VARSHALDRDSFGYLSVSENVSVASLSVFPGFNRVAVGSLVWLASGVGLQYNQSSSFDQPLGGVSFVS
jgi:hypothetical protein